MHIGIDGYEANVNQRVGIGQYAYQVLSGLAELDKHNNYTVFLPSGIREDMPKSSSRWRYVIGESKSFWTIRELPFLIKKQQLDLFFTPSHYMPLFTPILKVISVMDLSYLYYPQLFRFKDLLKLRVMGGHSIKQARHILTISEFSKREIAKHYHVPLERITVTYPGLQEKLKSHSSRSETQFEAAKKEFRIQGDYFLFVGTIQPRKNLVRLITAFEQLSGETQLIIIGKKGWLYEPILERIKTSSRKNRIKQLDFVPNELMSHFYENARALILPSLYEGFGIPVVEALYHGCPVVVSNSSSLPEVAAEAGIYVNPLEVDDIARGMREALQLKPERRRQLIVAGYKQIKKFSWEQCVKKTIAVFEKMIKE